MAIIKPLEPVRYEDYDYSLQFDASAVDLVRNINQWELRHPIVNPMEQNIVVKKGMSRKEVLDLMIEHKEWVLPVVSSLGGNYEGVVDYDSIVWQITKDLYKHPKVSSPKK